MSQRQWWPSRRLNARPLRRSVVRFVLNALMTIGVIILAAKLLKSLASGLWNKESSKTADEHEKSIDLKNMVHPGSLIILGSTVGTKGRDGSLPNNGSNF